MAIGTDVFAEYGVQAVTRAQHVIVRCGSLGRVTSSRAKDGLIFQQDGAAVPARQPIEKCNSGPFGIAFGDGKFVPK
jgi:hypothetical protein